MPASPVFSRADQRMVLLVTSLSGFLVTLMASSINIALPMIGSEFHASAVTLSWISLSYVMAAGIVLMPVARVASFRGWTRVFLWGSALLAVTFFAAALSPNAAVLVVLRFAQGVCSGIVFVTAPTMVTLAYPHERLGRAIGLNVLGVYSGTTLGPLLGGVIIHNLGWRMLFVVAGAAGVAVLLLAIWKTRAVDWREPRPADFDAFGCVAYALGLAAVLVGFSILPALWGAGLVGAGILGLVAFVWWEAWVASPVMDVALFRNNRVFAFSNMAAFINYAATFALTFVLSLYLQYNRGLNAQTAGFVLACGAFVQAAFSPLAGRLGDRMRAPLVAAAGMALCVGGLLAFVFLGQTTPYWYILLMLGVLGLGFAFFSTPISQTIMGSVEKRQLGTASATLVTMRLAGQSMSIGLATLMLAIFVGGRTIEPGDYPSVLASVRLSFVVFTVLCVFGVGATLAGAWREAQ